MCRSRRLSCALFLTAALVLSLGATSCGGGGSGEADSDLVLLGFNVPNIAGVPLNQPLIFTFSNEIDPSSIQYRVLRPGGTCILAVTHPCFSSDGGWVKDADGKKLYWKNYKKN